MEVSLVFGAMFVTLSSVTAQTFSIVSEMPFRLYCPLPQPDSELTLEGPGQITQIQCKSYIRGDCQNNTANAHLDATCSNSSGVCFTITANFDGPWTLTQNSHIICSCNSSVSSTGHIQGTSNKSQLCYPKTGPTSTGNYAVFGVSSANLILYNILAMMPLYIA